jgi:hypothetical protein
MGIHQQANALGGGIGLGGHGLDSGFGPEFDSWFGLAGLVSSRRYAMEQLTISEAWESSPIGGTETMRATPPCQVLDDLMIGEVLPDEIIASANMECLVYPTVPVSAEVASATPMLLRDGKGGASVKNPSGATGCYVVEVGQAVLFTIPGETCALKVYWAGMPGAVTVSREPHLQWRGPLPSPLDCWPAYGPLNRLLKISGCGDLQRTIYL